MQMVMIPHLSVLLNIFLDTCYLRIQHNQTNVTVFTDKEHSLSTRCYRQRHTQHLRAHKIIAVAFIVLAHEKDDK